jgi:hypothetical protein
VRCSSSLSPGHAAFVLQTGGAVTRGPAAELGAAEGVDDAREAVDKVLSVRLWCRTSISVSQRTAARGLGECRAHGQRRHVRQVGVQIWPQCALKEELVPPNESGRRTGARTPRALRYEP